MATESGARMLSYYPEVIRAIKEFKAITTGEGYEFDELKRNRERVLNNAYLLTMDESRILEWEKLLGIRPLENSTVDDRRDTVIARIRGQGKLNTTLINNIVNTFTGGSANSWIKDSVLYIEITPPPGNKAYKFSNVEQELKNKIPAHLGVSITRNYNEWSEIKLVFPTWQTVKDTFATWNDVSINNPIK